MKTLLLSVLLFSFAPAFCWTVPTRRLRVPSQSLLSRTRVYAQEENDAVTSEVEVLKRKAENARKEAQEMEKSFVDKRLQTLEKMIQKSKLSPSEQQDVQDKIDRLKNYQNPTLKSKNNTEEVEKVIQNLGDDEVAVDEEEFVGELSPEDREMLGQMQSLYFELEHFLSNITGDLDIAQEMSEIEQDFDNILAGNITQEDLSVLRTLTSFVNKVPNIAGMKERFIEAATEVAEATAEAKEMEKEDPYFLERVALIQGFLPQEMQKKFSFRTNQTYDIDEFVTQVMKGSEGLFEIKSKPRKIGPYSLLECNSLVADSDRLVDHLDKQLMASDELKDKLQFFFIRDPSAIAELDTDQLKDMILDGSDEGNAKVIENMGNMLPTSLLVIPADHKSDPSNTVLDRSLLFGLAMLCTAHFAGSCYIPDDSMMSQVSAGFSHPDVLLGLLGLAFVHDLGHFAVAALNKIEMAFPPNFFPSPSTGLLYTHTELTSAPRNNKALFDYAASGPLLGIVSSWGLLAYGLLQTALAKPEQIASLPHIPLDFLNLSCLTSATIESLIGTDVLLSLDPISESGVAVHPFVLAGHIGILMNALSLLPISSTSDGGRMVQAVFTKTGIQNNILTAFASVFLVVQGFRDWKVSGMLVLYAFVSGFVAHQNDGPCRNNVDPAGGFRAAILTASLLVAVVAVSPSF